MVPMSTINTRQLAEIMQRNCTVKKADILAVLDELVETMRDQMQDFLIPAAINSSVSRFWVEEK